MSNARYLPVPILLQEPRDLDGKPVTELSMRPPMAEDVFAAQGLTSSDMERDALLFANLTDTTPEFIKSLSFFDYKVVEAANGLFMLPIRSHLEKRFSFFPDHPEAPALKSSADTPSTNSISG